MLAKYLTFHPSSLLDYFHREGGARNERKEGRKERRRKEKKEEMVEEKKKKGNIRRIISKGGGGGNAETRRSRILLRKQPPRGGRGAFGREKNPAVENVKRKSAVRSQRADVSGRGWRRGRKTLWWLGRETLEKMENGRWCTAEGGVWNCHQRNTRISLADGRGRLMTSMVEEFFPPWFFKIVAEFSNISRGIARRRRDYYLKPGKCEWLGLVGNRIARF